MSVEVGDGWAVGVGLQVNKFEQVSSDDQQMSVAGIKDRGSRLQPVRLHGRESALRMSLCAGYVFRKTASNRNNVGP